MEFNICWVSRLLAMALTHYNFPSFHKCKCHDIAKTSDQLMSHTASWPRSITTHSMYEQNSLSAGLCSTGSSSSQLRIFFLMKALASEPTTLSTTGRKASHVLEQVPQFCLPFSQFSSISRQQSTGLPLWLCQVTSSVKSSAPSIKPIERHGVHMRGSTSHKSFREGLAPPA